MIDQSTKSDAIAAIDIGTNSIHLVVAQMENSGHMKILDVDKVPVRLGESIGKSGAISREGIRRTVDTIQHMLEISAAYPCRVRAIATHATREAVNNAELIEAVFKATGVKIDLIDGAEEARLVFLGMRHAMPLDSSVCLGMDIGGGSTELIIAKGDDIRFVASLKLGAVTMSKEHFGGKIPTPKQIKNLYEDIDMRLAPLLKETRHVHFTRAVASSGTAKALAAIQARAESSRDVGDANGYKLSRRGLEHICDELESLRSPEKISQGLKIDESRADIILAGAAIMRRVSEAFKVKEWIYSSYALREGIVVDTWRRSVPSRLSHAPNVRWESVLDLGKRVTVDVPQAKHVVTLATSLFEQLTARLYPGLVRPHRDFLSEMLRAAAYLHEAGRFIGITGYHRHSQYLVDHSRLMGFTQNERMFIAYVVRYHRKSMPPRKPLPGKESDFTLSDWEWMRYLAGILRLAVVLNRTRRQLVSSVRVRLMQGVVHLTVTLTRTSDVHVEMHRAELERKAIEDSIGMKVELRIAARAHIT